MMKKMIVGLLFLTGCYTAPSDSDFCVVPSTNNPDYTGKVASGMPQMPQMPGGF